jgi:hypothetical protein
MYKPVSVKDGQQPSEARGKAENRFSLSALRRNQAIPWSQISSLWNYRSIDFCYPSHFIIVALGN